MSFIYVLEDKHSLHHETWCFKGNIEDKAILGTASHKARQINNLETDE